MRDSMRSFTVWFRKSKDDELSTTSSLRVLLTLCGLFLDSTQEMYYSSKRQGFLVE